MMRQRPYRPWWETMPVYAKEAPDHRAPVKGAENVQGMGVNGPPGFGLLTAMGLVATPDRSGGTDPRESPSGDIARRGTIPPYVPFAVMNPGRYSPVPQ